MSDAIAVANLLELLRDEPEACACLAEAAQMFRLPPVREEIWRVLPRMKPGFGLGAVDTAAMRVLDEIIAELRNKE